MDNTRRQYQVHMGLTILLYAILLVPSLLLTDVNPDAAWRFPVAVMPMMPFVLGIGVYVRYLRRVDELQRRIAVEALAIAFGGTAGITFGYGFLENVGLPHVNWMFVWPVMAALWIVGGMFTRWQYR